VAGLEVLVRHQQEGMDSLPNAMGIVVIIRIPLILFVGIKFSSNWGFGF
jgi:hypothetical protein